MMLWLIVAVMVEPHKSPYLGKHAAWFCTAPCTLRGAVQVHATRHVPLRQDKTNTLKAHHVSRFRHSCLPLVTW